MNKRPLINPLAFLGQRARLDEDQQRDLGIAYRVSLQALLTGHGSEQAWSTLACTLNVALILCEYGICTADLNTIQHAQDALLRSRERAQRTDKWALDGDGIRVVQSALAIHDEQISRCTRQQITAALNEVHRRVSIGEVA